MDGKISSDRSAFLTWMIGILITLMTLGISFQGYLIGNLHAEMVEHQKVLNSIPLSYVSLARYTRVVDKLEQRSALRAQKVDEQFKCVLDKLDRLFIGQAELTGRLSRMFNSEKPKK